MGDCEMLEKLLIPGFTTILAVSVAAFWPQDEPVKRVENVESKVVTKDADPLDAIRDIYGRLRRLRAEKLADRPKSLSDEAAKLYRQALKAVEAKEFDKAQSLTKAATELTRALELSLSTTREAPSDPDLPAPPGPRTETRVFSFVTGEKYSELPPPLPAEVDKAARLSLGNNPATNKSGDEQTLIVNGDRIRLVRPSGKDLDRELIVENLNSVNEQIVVEARKAAEGAQKQAVTARMEAVKARDAAVNAHQKVLEKLHLDLKQIQGKDGAKFEIELPANVLEEIKTTEAVAKLHQSLTGKAQMKLTSPASGLFRLQGKAITGGVDKDSAIAELKRAYETILSAKKDQKSGDTKTYLDAARDLYNSARREAEAGRFERAAELSRAAQALTLVPKHLESLKSGHTFHHTVPGAPGDVQVFRFETKDGKALGLGDAHKASEGQLAKELHLKDGKEHKIEFKILDRDKAQEKRQIEVEVAKPSEAKKAKDEIKEHKVEVKVLNKEKDAESAPDAPRFGIGVMIDFSQGKANILDLIPDGSAAKDGRIQKGDAIVGIETDEGGTLGFADKNLEDIVKLLRGPVGSKVKLIVQPSGSKDRKVYEIERKKLEVPEASAGTLPGGKNLELPPQID